MRLRGIRFGLRLAGLLLSLACAVVGTPTITPPPLTLAPPAVTPLPTDRPPTEVPSPAPSAIPAPPVVAVAIVGPEEVVFDWTTQQCAPNDYPELPVRAFRDASGQVVVSRAGPNNRRFTGPDLDHLSAPCDVVYASHRDPEHANFRDEEWLQALYTEDGQTVHAILHNEDNCTPEEGGFCWYQNMTYAVSTDGGLTYQQPEPPANYLASPPWRFAPGAGVFGLTAGSNILKGQDGAYYTVAMLVNRGDAAQRTCLLRTDSLADPAAWRAWDGAGFNLAFVYPYAQPDAPPEGTPCPALAYDQIGSMHESLTYNTFLEQYVLLGSMASHPGGLLTWGIHYAVSDDLIHWSDRQLLIEMPLSAHYGPGGPDSLAYPVLLDPDSPVRNFDVADRRAYVYYARFNYDTGAAPQDVDLVRFPIEFFTSEAEAKAADARTRLRLAAEADGAALVLDGRLGNWNGRPIPGVAIDLALRPEGGPGTRSDYVLAGVVPGWATQALVGLRVNTECNCSTPADLAVYAFHYAEAGSDANRVPNGAFAAGLDGWGAWGSADQMVTESGQGAGSMLALTATSAQDAGLNSASFGVTPGAAYTFTVSARVAPESAGSGYFTLIFTGGADEGQRFIIPIRANSIPLGTVMTDDRGMFDFRLEAPPAMPGVVTARFAGDDLYWPSTADASE